MIVGVVRLYDSGQLDSWSDLGGPGRTRDHVLISRWRRYVISACRTMFNLRLATTLKWYCVWGVVTWSTCIPVVAT